MGGRYTLLIAGRSDRLERRRGLLGRVHRQRHARGALDPRAPRLPRSSWPGNCTARCSPRSGAEDQNPSPELGAELRERASASGQEVKVDVYEGAGHAFLADFARPTVPSRRPGCGEQIVPFLADHLQAER